MTRLAISALFVIVLGLVLTQKPHAAESDALFVVHGLSVDVSAQTATEARRKALSDAQMRAWQTLSRKLVDDESRERLPEPSAPLLERLVRAVDIRDERSSARRYLAEIDVSFHADAVRDLYARLGVSYTESRAGPYLLVPRLIQDRRVTIFGDHLWRQALETADLPNRLISYVFPEDDVRARRFLSPAVLRQLRPEQLAKISNAYESAKSVIATAQVQYDFGAEAYGVEYGFVLGPETKDTEDGLKSKSGYLLAEADETVQDLLARAADLILTQADADWKGRTLIKGKQPETLTVMAPVRSAEDWLLLRDRLQDVAIIRAFDIGMMQLPVSSFTLHYVGSREQLRLALEQVRISLRSTVSGEVIELADKTEEDAVTAEQ